jgi:rRNA maturation endonuclease Nob1
MNEAEKERLIKKDIVSIENRVRHAFNQGYEMGIKESRSEIPNTCEDAISRQEALNAITMAEVRWQAVDNVNKLPSVTPQQRTGRWIRMKAYEKWGCSECNTVFRFTFKEHDYCPNCGAKMEVEE